MSVDGVTDHRRGWDRLEALIAPSAGGDEGAGGRTPALHPHVRAALWVLLVAFCLQGVFGHSLWGGNDAREGGMIAEMVRSGRLVTPTLNGQPFLEKPPLLHWTGVAICRLAGTVSEGLLRLPAALYGFGTLVLVLLFVRGQRPCGGAGRGGTNELAAWAAVFLCATAVEFWEYSRIVLTDMALTFMVTLSLFLFWSAWERPGWRRWAAFLLASAAAFYAKGLIGPALIWCTVGAFLIWKRRLGLLIGLALAYVPVLIAVVAPWVAALYRSGGEQMVRFVFWDNQIGRFFSFADQSLPRDPFFIHKEPWYYYLLNVPIYVLPWTLLFVPALAAWWRRSSPYREPFHVFLRCGVVGIFLLLHASAAKVAVYALPAYPLLFILVGMWLVDLAQRDEWTKLERAGVLGTTVIAGGLFVLIPAAVLGGTFMRPDFFRTGGTLRTAGQVLLAGLVLVLIAGAIILLRRLAGSAARTAAFALTPAAAALIVASLFVLVTPVLEQQRDFRPFAALAKEQATLGTEIALSTGEFRDIGAFTFYLGRRLPNLRRPGEVAAFLGEARPRGVIIALGNLPAADELLAGVPHEKLVTGLAGTMSGSFALVVNQPALELAAEARKAARDDEQVLTARTRRIRRLPAADQTDANRPGGGNGAAGKRRNS